MNGELLRLVDSLHRDKHIDKEIVFHGIEAALLSATKKHLGSDDVVISLDRETGNITAMDAGREISPAELGRIAAQTAKQMIIQKIREAERDVIYEEYVRRISTVANGTVQRFEGSTMIVNLGKTEAILPRSEQIANESYHPGERVRGLITSVEKVGNRVKVVLSRSSPEFVQRLFELEVPEIAEGIITIKGIAREAGFRTKITVHSRDAKVDPVGACVGVRGSRIKNIVDELNGEKIDIIRWDESQEMFICNTLKPAEILGILMDDEEHRATVIVADDQLSLAIGKRGQNVRLASKLTGWDIDIMTQSQLDQAERGAEAQAEGAPAAAEGEAPAEEAAEAAADTEATEPMSEQAAEGAEQGAEEAPAEAAPAEAETAPEPAQAEGDKPDESAAAQAAGNETQGNEASPESETSKE